MTAPETSSSSKAGGKPDGNREGTSSRETCMSGLSLPGSEQHGEDQEGGILSGLPLQTRGHSVGSKSAKSCLSVCLRLYLLLVRSVLHFTGKGPILSAFQLARWSGQLPRA